MPAALDDFVVLVRIDDAELAAGADLDGLDIQFEDAGGSPLPFELESYSAGQLVAWVKLDLTGESQDFFMSYGGGDRGDHSDPDQVWTNQYAAVYHLTYDGNGSPDSSPNGNDLVRYNGVSTPGAVGDGPGEDDPICPRGALLGLCPGRGASA